jgi:hypothetical protein
MNRHAIGIAWLLLTVSSDAMARGGGMLLLGVEASPPPFTLLSTAVSSGVPDGTTTATVTPTLAGGGSLLVFTATLCADASCVTKPGITATITDGTQTCTAATGATTGTSANYFAGVWYCKNNTATGATAFTATFSQNCWYKGLEVSEWFGADLTAPDEGVGNKGFSNVSGTAITATTGTTITAGDLIISSFFPQQGTTFGQTRVGSFNQEYQIGATLTTYTNTYTISPASSWGEAIAAFKKAP